MKVQLKPRKICIGIISMVVILYCSIALFKTLTFLSSNKPTPMSESEFFELINATYGRRRVLERIELSDGSVVNVCDIIRIKHGRFYVFRLAEVPLGAHTTLLLKTPREFSLATINTVKWKIDRTYMAANSYLQSMISSMFKDMAIPLARNTQANTLAIGLGGGAINGMLHHFFPKMDITVVEYDEQMLSMAVKWFELELDEHHRVKLADGIKFIAEEAQQGSLYDIIFLDACDAGLVYIDTLCPVAGFLSDVVLRETAQLIGPRGILIVNALSIKLTADELEEYLMSRLLKVFKYCTSERPSASMNQVFSCSQQQLAGLIEMTDLINITLL